MKIRSYAMVLLLLVVLAPIVLSMLSRIPSEVGLVEGRLRECSSKPNCVCSARADRDSFVEPLAVHGNPDAAFRSLQEFLKQQSQVTIEKVEVDYIHSVFKTPLLRFCDDVEFHLDREAGVIQIRSAARIGYSDLGQNRDRVEWIREHWEAQHRTNSAPQ